MEKRFYVQPLTKLLSMVVCKKVCDDEEIADEGEVLYGPPIDYSYESENEGVLNSPLF